MSSPSASPLSAIETLLARLVPTVVPAPGSGRGRPATIPGAMLWAGMLVCILRQDASQRAIWRLLTAHGLWHWPRLAVSDDAIYRRLQRHGPDAMAQLFTALTRVLSRTPGNRSLAPFAREVVALDETTLDQVRGQGQQREVPRGDDRRIPGKVTALFDVRRQLFRTVRVHADFRENEKIPAWAMVRSLPKGSLLLTDLGYFSFPFYDRLTRHRQHWIARYREKTSFVPVHCFWEQDGSGEWLVWLGKHRADRAASRVRLIAVRRGQVTHRYLTNVTNPHRLSAQEVVQLYARRWDIELAFKTLKTQLGLGVLWSTHWAVIQTQVWAVLTIAQCAFHLRFLVAREADVDLFDVSLDLLREAPRFAARGADPVTAIAQLGGLGGFIRPSRRKQYVVPIPDTIALPPVGLPRWRPPRYAGRRCGPGRSDRRPT
jgi:hypothetical protein